MSKEQPYLIQDIEASGRKLSPLPVQCGAFKEEWLQKLLYKHPDILPLDHLGEAFTPAIPLGREIANIDNLFISPSGLITIVETKLWRNPEAHRTVLAQILDYANTLSQWSYQQLDKAVQDYTERMNGKAKTLYQLIKNKLDGGDTNEIEFQQKVQYCLENGKFALLIVGDKIYPGATQLSEIIQSAPHMQYTIGFVELKCYRQDEESDWPLIVVPNLLVQTKEITRAIVKVIYEEKKPEIEITTPKEDKITSGRTNQSEFIASLPSELGELFNSYISDWIKNGYTVYWGTVGFSLRLSWKNKLRTVFEAYPDYMSIYQEKRLTKDELPKELHGEYKTQLMNSSTIGSAVTNHRRYIYFKDVSKDDVRFLLKVTNDWAKSISEKSS